MTPPGANSRFVASRIELEGKGIRQIKWEETSSGAGRCDGGLWVGIERARGKRETVPKKD